MSISIIHAREESMEKECGYDHDHRFKPKILQRLFSQRRQSVRYTKGTV